MLYNRQGKIVDAMGIKIWRVLLTTHVFLPDYSSGTEILTFNTAIELQRLGYEVEVCTGFPARPGLADSQRFDSYEYAGIKVNSSFIMPSRWGAIKCCRGRIQQPFLCALVSRILGEF